MIVSDETLFNIAKVCRQYKEYNKETLRLDPVEAKGKGTTTLPDMKATDPNSLLCTSAHHCSSEFIKPSLRVLNINKSTTASNRGLRAVSEVCNTLERLEVARCPNITDVGLREILLVSSNLRVLNVSTFPFDLQIVQQLRCMISC